MIPKIIHHVWIGRDPFRQKFHLWRESWMRHNPDYTFMFWTSENFPYDKVSVLTSELLHSNLCFVMKADIAKYAVIALFGGIIVDTDMECLKNFDPLLNTSSFVGRSYPPDNICNAVLACEAGLPLYHEILSDYVWGIDQNWLAANDQRTLLDFDGGMHTLGKTIEARSETILPVETFFPFHWDTPLAERKGHYPYSYAIHHWNGKEPDGWTNVDFTKNKESRKI